MTPATMTTESCRRQRRIRAVIAPDSQNLVRKVGLTIGSTFGVGAGRRFDPPTNVDTARLS